MKVGDRVKHVTKGEGTIVEVDSSDPSCPYLVKLDDERCNWWSHVNHVSLIDKGKIFVLGFYCNNGEHRVHSCTSNVKKAEAWLKQHKKEYLGIHFTKWEFKNE